MNSRLRRRKDAWPRTRPWVNVHEDGGGGGGG
jgi:hypothetical protein